MNNFAIIGYSGHAYVCLDAAFASGVESSGYFENKKKERNPFNLKYLGSERDANKQLILSLNHFFVGIGNNAVREKVCDFVKINLNKEIINIFHPQSTLSALAKLDGKGILICAGATINPLCTIKKGVIINTNASVDHECTIGKYSHIAPNATLCGNVKIGKRTFVGAGAVIKEGIIVGDDVVIGAGAVVVKDIDSGTIVMGNPARPK